MYAVEIMSASILFSHVYKTYRGSNDREVHALRDVSFEVDRGEFVFLTGPSGAGKTTLFRLMSAFDRATSGRVEVAGVALEGLDRSSLPHYRRKIGVVFQDFRLLAHRSVFENVALPLEIIGEAGRSIDRRSIERRVHELLESVGLADKADELPTQMSGGEQQRVAIARALAPRPSVLFADEPTGNLDFERARDVMDLFERANSQGTTVFVATHDRELLKAKPKRTLQLRGGVLQHADESNDFTFESRGEL